MASSETSPQEVEKTFRNYNTKQSAAYAQARRGYHPNLLQRVVDHHVATGGQLGTIVDVGCGPGFVARAMAPQFDRAVGFDPSPAMIETAQGLGGTSRSGDPIRFELSTAEALGRADDGQTQVEADGTVDLITAAAAAHWFDLPRFYARASRLLRPGGTIALWIVQPKNAHPSVPNAAALNAALQELNDRELRPFMAPGNLLVEDLYKDLLLPWTIPNAEAASDLDQASFVRIEWGPGHENSDAEGNELLNGTPEYTMDMFELGMATASPVTRWREANPDKAGTEADVVRIMRRTAERLLREAGVPEGKEVVRSQVLGALLLVKKKKEAT